MNRNVNSNLTATTASVVSQRFDNITEPGTSKTEYSGVLLILPDHKIKADEKRSAHSHVLQLWSILNHSRFFRKVCVVISNVLRIEAWLKCQAATKTTHRRLHFTRNSFVFIASTEKNPLERWATAISNYLFEAIDRRAIFFACCALCVTAKSCQNSMALRHCRLIQVCVVLQ